MANIILPRPVIRTSAGATHDQWQIATPKETHMRPAGCEEAMCRFWAEGWDMTIDGNDPELGSRQVGYIRYMSGRRFTEEQRPDGFITFRFEGGQQCFREHWKKLERGPWLFRVQGSPLAPHYIHQGRSVVNQGFAQVAERNAQDWEDWRDQMNEATFRHQRERGLTN